MIRITIYENLILYEKITITKLTNKRITNIIEIRITIKTIIIINASSRALSLNPSYLLYY